MGRSAGGKLGRRRDGKEGPKGSKAIGRLGKNATISYARMSCAVRSGRKRSEGVVCRRGKIRGDVLYTIEGKILGGLNARHDKWLPD
jgi:hypothetical protein